MVRVSPREALRRHALEQPASNSHGARASFGNATVIVKQFFPSRRVASGWYEIRAHTANVVLHSARVRYAGVRLPSRC